MTRQFWAQRAWRKQSCNSVSLGEAGNGVWTVAFIAEISRNERGRIMHICR